MTQQTHLIKLSEKGSFLGSRVLGLEFREQIELFLDQGDDVIVDLAGVHLMTHSFADETFGKVVKKLGLPDFKRRVLIRNLDPKLIPFIRYVLKYRVETVA